MQFSEGSGSFLRPTIPELWRFLGNQLRRFLDKVNTQIWEDFKNFRHKAGIFRLQKVQKRQFKVKWLHNVYLTQAKSRALSLFIENTPRYCLEFWPCTKWKYSLQTRTLPFPDQENLLEKVDLRYLKTLKTKNLNTKNSQIKYFPCSKCVMIYRHDLYNLETRKKQLKK